jgi:hypothetical protein
MHWWIKLVNDTTRRAGRIVALCLCFGCLSGHADELAEKGKAIFKKHHEAVVTVQLVLKSKISLPGLGGQANESRQDVTGTVVDPSGVTVLSLSATDPAAMLQSMVSIEGDEESRFKMESELSDVKILLADGTEIAAEVILRDKDLDLAFVRPKTRVNAPMPALDLSQAGTAEILDQVLTLNRLGNAASRAYSATLARIAALVQKPRLYYVPDASLGGMTLGAPAFTLDGKVLGLFVVRASRAKSGGGGFGMFTVQNDHMTEIIVPAQDIARALKQVPAMAADKKP